MAPGRVVEVLDVVGHADGQLEVCAPTLSIEELNLHGPPERLHRGVVVAVADGAHGADEAQAPHVLGESPRGVLGPVV